MAILFLVLLLCVNSALAAHSGCVSHHISLHEKLRLNADANDHDGNQVTTSSDIIYDLDNNYDTNGDGAVDEKEWIAEWTCAYGDTAYFARFIFNIISGGKAAVYSKAYTGEPYATGFPRAAFISRNRERYELFQKYGCVNTDLTMEQKLTINLAFNNHNNDSVVDSTDIAYDLNTNYDTNNDTKVSQAEWVMWWSCVYGDTAEYSRYVWSQVSQGADFIQASQFTVPPFDTGLPLKQFEASNRQRYETFAAMQSQPPVGK